MYPCHIGWVQQSLVGLYFSHLKRKQELFLYGTKSRKVLKLYSVKWLRFLTNFTAILSIIFYCSYVVSVNQKLVITVPLVIYAIFRYNKLSSSKIFQIHLLMKL